MIDTENIISALAPFIFGIIQLITIIACVLIVMKKSSLATIIMLASSIISGILSVIRPIVYSLDIGNDFMLINNIFTLLNALFYGLFAIGLFMFALNYKKVKKE